MVQFKLKMGKTDKKKDYQKDLDIIDEKAQEIKYMTKNGKRCIKFSERLWNYGVNPFIQVDGWKRWAIDKIIPMNESIKDYSLLLIKNNGDMDFYHNVTPGNFYYMDRENNETIHYSSILTENKLKSLNRHKLFIQVTGRAGPEPSNNALDSKAFYEFYLAIDNENTEMKKMLNRHQLALLRAMSEKWWVWAIIVVVLYVVFSGDSGGINISGMTSGFFGGGGSENVVLNETLNNATQSTTTIKLN